MQTNYEGPGPSDPIAARVAGIEAAVDKLTQAFFPEPVSGKGRLFTPPAQGPALTSASAAAGFPGPDPGVVATALVAGVSEDALQEMQRLIATDFVKLRPDTRPKAPARKQTFVDSGLSLPRPSADAFTSGRRPQEPEPLPWTKLWTGLGRTKVV